MREKVFISPSRYIQGKGVIESTAADYIAKNLGRKILMISGRHAYEAAGKTLLEKLTEKGVEVKCETFRGQSSAEEISRISAICREGAYEALLAVGGGKIGDTARGVIDETGMRLGVVPTIAATDAPVASLYAIYDDNDELQVCKFTRNPDLVIVDTDVISKSPERYLAAGMADALATWVEARANSSHNGITTAGGHATIAGLAIAERCEEIIFGYGIQAYEANKAKVVTPALEYVVEANILLSGIGYESGGLAAAHAIHNGLTILGGETEKIMHGEKVAYGTLAQLFLENRPLEEIDRFVTFYRTLHLPTTFKDLLIEGISYERLLEVGRAATAEGDTMKQMPFEVTAEDVADALVAVDSYVRAKYEG